MTVQDAIKRIRRTGEDSELIYTCYVIDDRRLLEGVVTVKDLLLAQDDETIGALMEPDVITAETTEDREEAVQRMMKYDFISMPVVDRENRLVGIVTVDDVMDVMEEEATEDFEKMAAIVPSERPYLRTGVFTLAKNRHRLAARAHGFGHDHRRHPRRYEAAFAAMPLLVTFIPMLTDTGGNAGSQSSTLVIRGMAVGDIGPADFFQVLWKELRVSLVVGAALSAVNFARLLITHPGSPALALTVALALFATVVMAKTIGRRAPDGRADAQSRPGHHGRSPHHHDRGRVRARHLFFGGAGAARPLTDHARPGTAWRSRGFFADVCGERVDI